MAHGAVPLSTPHHVVLHVDHKGPAGLQLHHIETLADQIVTRHEGDLLTLGERAGLTPQTEREEDKEEEGGQHRSWEEEESQSLTCFRSAITFQH